MTSAPARLRQAGCVAVQGRGILIEGPPGSGKSSLALALIDRGAMLIADDGVVLTERAGELWVAPHPNTQGLLEVRNLGILSYPSVAESRVCLLLRLDTEAPRFIDAAEHETILGVEIPALRLWPATPVLALRAELALGQYGRQ
jgi:serine kinase of HPr protein (carbohydrate metabolism regulator)